MISLFGALYERMWSAAYLIPTWEAIRLWSMHDGKQYSTEALPCIDPGMVHRIPTVVAMLMIETGYKVYRGTFFSAAEKDVTAMLVLIESTYGRREAP